MNGTDALRELENIGYTFWREGESICFRQPGEEKADVARPLLITVKAHRSEVLGLLRGRDVDLNPRFTPDEIARAAGPPDEDGRRHVKDAHKLWFDEDGRLLDKGRPALQGTIRWLRNRLAGVEKPDGPRGVVPRELN